MRVTYNNPLLSPSTCICCWIQHNSKWLIFLPLLTTFNATILKCFCFVSQTKIHLIDLRHYITLHLVHASFLLLTASTFLSKAVNSGFAMALDPEALCLIPVKDCTASHSFLSADIICPLLFVSALSPPLYTACSQFSGIDRSTSRVEWLDGSSHTTWLLWYRDHPLSWQECLSFLCNKFIMPNSLCGP